jgi:hypothetical protein
MRKSSEILDSEFCSCPHSYLPFYANIFEVENGNENAARGIGNRVTTLLRARRRFARHWFAWFSFVRRNPDLSEGKFFMIKLQRSIMILAFALASLALLDTKTTAQTRSARAANDTSSGATTRARANEKSSMPAAFAPLIALPACDVAALADARRILNETMPRILANDPARLAKANAEIEDFKNKTGLDPRQFDTVAVGARFKDAGDNSWKDVDSVIVARGAFNAGALSAAARIGANGKYREEKYRGQSIYLFNIAEQIKAFGLFNINPGEYAVTTLDANTIAFGKPDMVRQTIDAKMGRTARVSNDTVSLVTRNAGALVAYGGNVPPSLVNNVRVGNEEISRSIASIKKFYGALNATSGGYDSSNALITTSADSAARLSDTLYALKQFAPLAMRGVSGDKGKVARDAVDNLQINAQGAEVQIRTSITQSDLEILLRGK